MPIRINTIFDQGQPLGKMANFFTPLLVFPTPLFVSPRPLHLNILQSKTAGVFFKSLSMFRTKGDEARTMAEIQVASHLITGKRQLLTPVCSVILFKNLDFGCNY